MEVNWLTKRDILSIHSESIAEFGGELGILSPGSLDSTLNKPKNLNYYQPNITLYDLAASYGYGFIKNHCFVDGNKRTAFFSICTFLGINGIELTASDEDAIKFFLGLAAAIEIQEEAIERLRNWIKDNSSALTKF